MDKYTVITNTKFLDSYDQGEKEEICSWDEQELNTDFTDWDWNNEELVYEQTGLVDGEDQQLSDSEYESWKKGEFEAYRIYRQAKVYELVRVVTI